MAKNVLGGQLQPSSTDPLTGWTRTGCCESGPEDLGAHTVCVRLTPAFLACAGTGLAAGDCNCL